MGKRIWRSGGQSCRQVCTKPGRGCLCITTSRSSLGGPEEQDSVEGVIRDFVKCHLAECKNFDVKVNDHGEIRCVLSLFHIIASNRTLKGSRQVAIHRSLYFFVFVLV